MENENIESNPLGFISDEELRGEVERAGFKDADSLVKSFLETKAEYQRLKTNKTVPLKAEDYRFNVKEEDKEFLPEDVEKTFRQEFLELGFSNEDANRVLAIKIERHKADQKYLETESAKKKVEVENDVRNNLGENVEEKLNNFECAINEILPKGLGMPKEKVKAIFSAARYDPETINVLSKLTEDLANNKNKKNGYAGIDADYYDVPSIETLRENREFMQKALSGSPQFKQESDLYDKALQKSLKFRCARY